MCGSNRHRHLFAKREVKYFAGMKEYTAKQVTTLPLSYLREKFPNRKWFLDRGFGNERFNIENPAGHHAALVTWETDWRPIDRVVNFLKTPEPTICDARCRNARGMNCECSCGGTQHGANVAMSRTRFALMHPRFSELSPHDQEDVLRHGYGIYEVTLHMPDVGMHEYRVVAAKSTADAVKYGKIIAKVNGFKVAKVSAKKLNARTRFALSDLDLKPTAQMASNAERGLELREKHGKGGTAVGVARARDIKNRANLSPETVKRMHSFFSRHAGNEKGGEDDAGYISFMLWGGAAGREWAASRVKQIDKQTNARVTMAKRRAYTKETVVAGYSFKSHTRIDRDDGSVLYLGFIIKNPEIPNPERLHPANIQFAEVIVAPDRKSRQILVSAWDGQSAIKAQDGRATFSHNIAIPKTRKRLSLDAASAAMQAMGYRIGNIRYDSATRQSVYKVTQPNGVVVDMPAKQIIELVYRKAQNMKNGTKAAFGLERSINIMLSDARIPDSAFDWRDGFLIVDPQYHDRIVEVLKGYIPWELKSLPRIRKEAMSRPGAKAKFATWEEGQEHGRDAWSATINKRRWVIILSKDGVGDGTLYVQDEHGVPRFVKRGFLDALKQYAETQTMSRPGAKAKFSAIELKGLIEPLRRADAQRNTREMNILLRRVIAVCKAGEIEFPRAAMFYESAKDYAMDALNTLQSDGAASLGHGDAARNLDNAVGKIMSVGRTGNYSRPGAKEAFQNLVTEAQSLSSALDRDDQIITDKASVRKDRLILAELVRAYLGGDYSRAANRWSALSAGARVTPQGQDIKRRLEWGGIRFSRPGKKSTHAFDPFTAPAKPDDWDGKRVTMNGRQYTINHTGSGYDLFDLSSGRKAKTMSKDELDSAWSKGRIRDVFSRPGAKAAHSSYGGLIREDISEPLNAPHRYTVGQRVTDAFLSRGAAPRFGTIKRQINLKGYPAYVVTWQPSGMPSDEYDHLLTKASRPGAKVQMGRAEQVLRDGTVHLDFKEAEAWLRGLTDDQLRYIVKDARAAANAAPDGKKWNYYHDLVLTASDELIKRKRKASRPGVKAAFARWDETQTKKNGKPITEYTATINGNQWMIEVSDSTGGGVVANLYLWDDLRGMQRIKTGRLQELQNYAESMGKRETRRVANIERVANYSRPGAKAKFSQDFKTRLSSLIQRFGFKPDKVDVNTRFGVGTIEFVNQRGAATRLVSKLAPTLAQMGIPASSISAREHDYPADEELGEPATHRGFVTIDFNILSKHEKPGFGRAGEAEAFAIGADSSETDPTRDEALTALCAKVGREHTVNLFKRWTEGKASFGTSYPSPSHKSESGGGTWTTKTARYGSKKASVAFYNKNGLVGSVYQDPDNPSVYKAFDEPSGREIASGSESACRAAVEKLAMSRHGAKATHAATPNDPRSQSDTDTKIDYLLKEAESAIRHLPSNAQRMKIVREYLEQIPALMRSNTDPNLLRRWNSISRTAGITDFSRPGAKASN